MKLRRPIRFPLSENCDIRGNQHGLRPPTVYSLALEGYIIIFMLVLHLLEFLQMCFPFICLSYGYGKHTVWEVYIRAYGEARFELCTLSTHMLEGGATLIMHRRKGRFPNVQYIPQLIISLVTDNSRSKKMPLDFDSGSWAGNSSFTTHVPV